MLVMFAPKPQSKRRTSELGKLIKEDKPATDTAATEEA
jgi:hypothetical protein